VTNPHVADIIEGVAKAVIATAKARRDFPPCSSISRLNIGRTADRKSVGSKGVPGVFSQGTTLAELRDNVRDAYQMMVEDEEQLPEGSQTVELTIDG
jgi:hypothetical protein